MAGFLGFLTTITFLANAYRFYLPAMIGLAIAISTAGKRFMDENAPGLPASAQLPGMNLIPHRA
jgi:hypothetical protein